MVGESTIYADDTCFIYHSKEKDVLEAQIKADMEKYLKWLEGNKLVINLTKTNYMVFKPTRKRDIQLCLTTSQYKLERVRLTKYLGITLDEKLDWKEHIKSIKKKVFGLVGALKRCPRLEKRIATLVYNGHILSKIRPNVLIWSQCNNDLQQQIQRLMNRVLKILFNLDYYTPSVELETLTKTTSLEQIINSERCKFVFKINKGLIKTNLVLKKNEEFHRYNLRNNKDFRPMSSRTKRMRNGIYNSAVTEFNKLPTSIKQITNLAKFTKSIKLYFSNS